MAPAPRDLLLAIDTSTPTARVAILGPDAIVRAEASRVAVRHSSHLLGLVDQVLTRAGVALPDLAGIACGRGPGSFTGLRVGLAVVKGLALAAERPLVLVSSLQALALDLARASAAPEVVPCLDAGKGQLHAAVFAAAGGRVEAASAEWLVAPDRLAAELARRFAAAVLGGPGAALHRDALAGRPACAADGPSAAAVGHLAWARLLRGESDDLATAAPAYGRPPDITRPRRRPDRE